MTLCSLEVFPLGLLGLATKKSRALDLWSRTPLLLWGSPTDHVCSSQKVSKSQPSIHLHECPDRSFSSVKHTWKHLKDSWAMRSKIIWTMTKKMEISSFLKKASNSSLPDRYHRCSLVWEHQSFSAAVLLSPSCQRQGAPWISHQQITGLTYKGRQSFAFIFLLGNLSPKYMTLYWGRHPQGYSKNIQTLHRKGPKRITTWRWQC